MRLGKAMPVLAVVLLSSLEPEPCRAQIPAAPPPVRSNADSSLPLPRASGQTPQERTVAENERIPNLPPPPLEKGDLAFPINLAAAL